MTNTTTEPDLFFTYGTLRPGLGERTEAREFRAKAKLIGSATLCGKLYAIDWYPGAVDSADPRDIVLGDLFWVGGASNFFTNLDVYEGCAPSSAKPHEYRRTIREVSHDGKLIPAWVYLYNWEITDQKRIKSGDFADHVT